MKTQVQSVVYYMWRWWKNIWFLPVIFAPIWVMMYWYFIDTQPPLVSAVEWGLITRVHGEEVDNKEPPLSIVKAGGTFEAWRTFCFATPTYAMIDRTFVDGAIYDTPQFWRYFQSGCYTRKGIVPVPDSLPSGYYDYQVTLTFQVNPLVSKTVRLPSIPLYVQSNIPGNAASPSSIGGSY